jgi:hypothetical protein
VGKYGTNLEGFGAFEGGVNADKGAPLVSTSSDGETALLFGPAALREIQAGVANGDFAIPPDAAGDTITESNPLPYWTFTDTDSNGAITCAIESFSGAASGNVLLWTVAANTPTGKTASITRYVPVPSSRDEAYSSWLELTAATSDAHTDRKVIMTLQFYTSDLTALGTAITRTFSFADFVPTRTGVFLFGDTSSRLVLNYLAAFAKITISIDTTGTNASQSQIRFFEVKMLTGQPMLMLAPRLPTASAGPASIWKESDALYISADIPTTASATGSLSTTRPYIKLDGSAITNSSATTISGALTASAGVAVTGDITATGDIGLDGNIYFDSALTGPYIQQAGTNGRIISVANATGTSGTDLLASSTSTRSGILVTKSVTGQPTTTINGTGATDAFADALRNGGLAVDTTNSRLYAYAGGAWKFAALTTPSDSRLKEEITAITGALDTLRQLVPVAFKWKRPEAHPRTDAVADDGKRLGFIADQVATTDLKGWVEDMGAGDLERDLVEDTDGRVLAVNIPQNEMEALVVQALLDIDTRLKALEAR